MQKAWRIFIGAIVLFSTLSSTRALASEVPIQEFTDNFDNLNDGNVIGQNGWLSTGLGTASWTIGSGGPSGSVKMLSQTSATANVINGVITNTSTSALGDSEIVADFKMGSGSNPQVWIRRAGSYATTTGYALTGPDTNIRIYKNDSSGLTQLSVGTVTTTITAGNWYTLEFRAVNNGNTVNLTGYIYPKGGQRPGTPTITASDSNNSAPSGYAGLGAHGGSVDYDNVVVNSIITQPSQPRCLSAIPQATFVDLSWTAPSSTGGSTITDYVIEYRTGGGSYNVFSDGTGTSTNVSVTGLTVNTGYDFKVSAVNAAGTGDPSTVVSATTTLTVPTQVFSDNIDSLNDGNIIGQNNWAGTGAGTAVWSVGSGAACGNSGKMLSQTSATANILNGAITNTSTSAGDSEIVADFKMGSGSNPQIWIRRAGTAANTNAYLMTGPAANIRIFKNNASGVTQISSGTVTTTIDAGTWYTIAFRATNNGSTVNLKGWIYTKGTTRPDTPIITATDSTNNSPSGYPGLGAHGGTVDYDNVKLYSLTTIVPPSSPQNPAVTTKSTRATLTWAVPTSTGGSPITDYVVEYRTGANPFTVFSDGVSTATQATVTGLTNGTSYDYRILAVNVAGTGSTSTVISATSTAVNIPVDNLKLWLRAGTETYQSVGGSTSTDNTPVGEWRDVSGNGNHVQQATGIYKPTLLTSIINGKPIIRFDGTGDYISNSVKSNWKFLHDTTGFSTFFVMKTTEANPGAILTLYNTGGAASTDIGSTLAYDDVHYNNGLYAPVLNSTTPYQVQYSSPADIVATQTPQIIDSTYLYGASGNDFNAYVNGANVSSKDSGAAPTSSDPTYNLTLGAMSGGSSYLYKGDIAEVALFNARLATEEREQVECYLSAKFNITASTDCVAVVPMPVLNLSGSAEDTEADLSWSAPTSTGTPITDYIIQYRATGTSSWTTYNDGTSVNTTTTVTGLTVATYYDFRVIPVNAVGQGFASNVITMIPWSTTPTAPTASNVSISGNVNVNGLLTGNYTFSDVNNDTEGTSTYRWLRADTADGTYAAITGATKRKYLLTSVDLSKYIKFEVTPVATVSPTTGNAATSTAAGSVGSALSLIRQILSTGQSLSIGSGGSPALTTSQPYNNVMLNAGQTALIPLVESSVETISSAMANTISYLESTQVYRGLVSIHGTSASAYTALKKGTTPYNNGMTQMNNALSAVVATGSGFLVDAVTVIHGETDHINGTTASQYEANLVEWQTDYQADVQNTTGQTNTVPMFTDQMGSFTTLNSSYSGIPMAQLAAAENNPTKIYLVGPKYFLPYADGQHLINTSYRWLGEYYGKVMKKVLIDGQSWKPLSPKLIVRNGNLLYAKFNVPAGQLAWDTSQVSQKTNYGFEYYDNSSSASISSVELFNSDTVKVTLSATPSGANQRLRYAYTGTSGTPQSPTTTGAIGGNLRDTDSTTPLYGSNLYNWCVQFDKTITLDETGPTLSNISSSPGETTATITWTTSENATAQVEYGTTDQYGSQTAESDTSYDVSSHNVGLTGLTSCTLYHYRVKSKDLAQNQTVSGDYTFTTTGCP